MLDDVAKDTLDAGLASLGLYGGPDKVAEIDPPDRRHWQCHARGGIVFKP
jgi:hypothetical protein